MPVWLARPVAGVGTLTRAGGNEQAACNSDKITAANKSLELDRSGETVEAITADIEKTIIPNQP